MSPLWHPLATLFLCDPPGYATEGLVRMLSRAGPLRLRYAGDRMWPALRHGQLVEVHPPAVGRLRAGAVVLASVDGVPDLLRVEKMEQTRLTLAADADAEVAVTVGADRVLGTAACARRRIGPAARHAYRLGLDLAEAWRGRIDRANEPARTVLDKYEAQAEFYADVEGPLIEPALVEALDERCEPASDVLVVGSGTGRECFGLAHAGYRVLGIDFAPAMVAQANGEGRRRSLDVEFVEADVRTFHPGSRRFAAIVFTYEVYSFLSGRAARVDMLRRMGGWLTWPALLLLSARRVRSLPERVLLSVQYLASLRRAGAAEWGASHTRWIAANGELRRSYVRLFTERQLRREAGAAGFGVSGRVGGHYALVPTATMST